MDVKFMASSSLIQVFIGALTEGFLKFIPLASCKKHSIGTLSEQNISRN